MINNVNDGVKVVQSPMTRRFIGNSQRVDGLSFENVLNARRNNVEQPERRIERRPTGQNGGDNNIAHRVSDDGQNIDAVSQEPETNEAQIVESEENAEDVQISQEIEIADEILPEYDQLLASIAAILSITVQELAETLGELNIQPEDLDGGEAQITLLKAIHGLENEVELLNLPDVLPIMNEMTAIAADYEPVLVDNADADASIELFPLEAEAFMQIASAIEAKPADVSAAAQVATTEQEITVDTTQTTEQIKAPEPVAVFNTLADVAVDDVTVPKVTAEAPQGSVNPQNVMEQVISNMRFEAQGSLAEIRIQLKPDHLGEVNLRVATINGIVVAQFVAENQRVKEIIEAGFNQLRDALEEQGINVSDIEVSVGNGQNDNEFSFEANISPTRIQSLMEGGEEELETQAVLEENVVDYRA